MVVNVGQLLRDDGLNAPLQSRILVVAPLDHASPCDKGTVSLFH
ncbi:MAG: hypothetical protein P4M11_07715 [Candidatus Pacebacteria bacterium]|nr:hypothetical protein [Candidatus Paceibacterota bacterium]